MSLLLITHHPFLQFRKMMIATYCSLESSWNVYLLRCWLRRDLPKNLDVRQSVRSWHSAMKQEKWLVFPPGKRPPFLYQKVGGHTFAISNALSYACLIHINYVKLGHLLQDIECSWTEFLKCFLSEEVLSMIIEIP